MEQSEERALAERLVRMEDAAWVQFARLYHRPLLAFVGSRFDANPETCEEIVQMTFVRCVKSIATFDPERGSLLTWLRAVAANEGHTLARANLRAPSVSLSSIPEAVAAEIASKLASEPLPEEILARKDVEAAVHETLLDLNVRYQDVLVMKYVEGLKVARIAEALGISEKAVESLLVRSREAFRQAFTRRLRAGRPELPERLL